MSETAPPIPPITPAELKCLREFLGLSSSWLAEHVHCDERRLQRMEMGQEEIPEAIGLAMDQIYTDTLDAVDRLTEKYRAQLSNKVDGEVVMPVYRNDAEYARAFKHARFPVRWHRQVAARVADRLPELQLDYSEPYRVNLPPWKRGDNHGKKPVPHS